MTPRLPTKADFIEHPDDPDQRWAWGNFGGLTLEEAMARFMENPHSHQEDFMFMGTRAFLFYFPILDQYLRGIPDEEHFDDNSAWIIAKGIDYQFNANTRPC